MNIQPTEGTKKSNGQEIEIVGRPFTTIQGEGHHSGRPAVFIRLAGCNLQCPACDTDYTTNRQTLKTDNIIKHASQLLPEQGLFVLTGGEPFRQNIFNLVIGLTEFGDVQIETNGLLWLDSTILETQSDLERKMKWNLFHNSCDVVVSPKTTSIHEGIQHVASSYKYIVDANMLDPNDGLPTSSLNKIIYGKLARPPADFPKSRIFLQPCEDPDQWKTQANIEAAVKSCINFGYRLSLQTHKLLGLS